MTTWAALWLLNLLIVTMTVDRIDVGEGLVDRALAIARARGSANRFALASNLRAMLRHCAGDLRGAEADADAALASEGLKGPMAYQSLIPLVGSLTDQGRAEEGWRVLTERGLDGEVPQARPLTALLVERGRQRLAAGEAGAGLSDLEEADRRLAVASAGRGAIGLDAWLERILALRALGRGDEARGEAEEALAAARGWGTERAIGGALRVAGLLSEGEDRLDQLSEAVVRLEASQARLWHARALVDLGVALAGAGARPRAREALERGLELAGRCGATPLAAAARLELAALGVEIPLRENRRDSLTATQRHLGGLAADGLSDTEIAQRLFVTVKAVEDQLADAQRKLGLRSRRELCEALTSDSPL